MKKVSFLSNQQTVTGTLHFPELVKGLPVGRQGKNPAALFIHGWMSNEDGYYPRAKALTELGFVCLTINLRGHGTSSGKLQDYSRKDHVDDSLAAYDFLASQTSVDANNISIVGASYGGYLAAIVAEKRKITALALRAPALYPNTDFDKPTVDLLEDREDEFFQNFEPEIDNFALHGVKNVNSLLLIESELDQIIPHRIIELYKNPVKDKTKLTHKIIKEADHQLSKEGWKQEYIELLKGWFGDVDNFTPTP